MKALIALALLLLSTPLLAAPENGTFWDPKSEVVEGLFVTTSTSTKVSFSLFTTGWQCRDKSSVDKPECWSHQEWYVSDLNNMILGESKGVLSTAIDGEVFTVGTYTLNVTDTGYTLKVVASGGTPLDFDNRIYDTDGFDFNTCIVSPDPTCGLVEILSE